MSECRLCRSTHITTRDYPGNSELNFEEIALCGDCEFGWAIPFKTQPQLDAYYSKGAYWDGSVVSNEVKNHYLNQSRHRLKKVKPFCPANSSIEILDYGAGFGGIADRCAQIFPRAKYFFFEPDPNMAQTILDKKLPIKATQVHLIESGKYDLIFLNHVLEHVADPIAFLEQVITGLKDGGVIYIETPRHDFVYKNDVHPHTLFFGEKSFNKLAAQLNLKILALNSFGSALSFKKVTVLEKLLRKSLSLGYKVTSALNLPRFAFFFNSLIFRYDWPSDRIWVMGIFKKAV